MRSIDHNDILAACEMANALKLLNANKSRTKADYDPTEQSDFLVPQVRNKISEAREAIRRFDRAPLKHRKAYAILVAIKRNKERLRQKNT